MKISNSGLLILVVGNSGSGKDSIIKGVLKNYSRDKPKIHSVRRYITRPPSETEENIAISPIEFKKMNKKRQFALKWKIYGLHYGVPIEIENWLENGDIILVNVSRKIINKARKKYKNVKVVFIQVPLEISIQRLKQRGRESKKRLDQRIERARKNQISSKADYIIDNSGKLEDSINCFLEYLNNLIDPINNKVKSVL